MKHSVLCAVFLWIAGFTAHTQTFSVSGTVRDELGSPTPGVSVELHELMQTQTTDSLGQFHFTYVKPGNYHLDIHLLGYRAQSVNFSIQSKDAELEIAIEPADIEIGELVIEESVLQTKDQESSLKIDVLNKSYLQSHSAPTFAQQLDRLPGLNAISTGSGVSKPMIRGFSFNRVIVADKGIKQVGQAWGWDHGLELDQFDIDRVEIIKGPASFLYGSDAIGGVIHIRFPYLPDRGEAFGEVLGTYRSVNQLYGTSVQAGVRLNHWYLAARFSYQNYGDYNVPVDSFIYNGYVLPVLGRKMKNTAGVERDASFFAGLYKGWGYLTFSVSRVDQQVGFFAGAHGVPKVQNLLSDGNTRDIDLPSQGVVHWKGVANTSVKVKNGRLEADLGFQFNQREELSRAHSHGDSKIPDTLTLEHGFYLFGTQGNVRYRFELPNRMQWVVGVSAEGLYNRSQGFSYLLPDYYQWGAASFAYFNMPLADKWYMNMGARFDYAGISVLDFEMPVYNTSSQQTGVQQVQSAFSRNYVNGASGIGFSYRRNSATLVKFNVASSFRNPTVPELTANGVHHGTFRHEKGDSSLTPERSVQVDLVLDFKKKNWFFSLSPFFYYLHQYIYLNPSGEFSPLPAAGQIYQYAQTNAIQTGMEIQVDAHFLKHFHTGLVVDGVWGYNLRDGYNLPFIPPVMANLELEYTFPEQVTWLENPMLQIRPTFALPQQFVARNEKTTPGYAILDVGCSVGFKWKFGELQLSLDVQNLLNTPYLIHVNRYRILNIPEGGRNFIVTARLKMGGKIKK